MVDRVEIGLPRPRSLQLVLSAEFLDAKRRLLDPLRGAMPDQTAAGA
jgi:hypothetical protein